MKRLVKSLSKLSLGSGALLVAGQAYAADAVPHFINYYELILRQILPHEAENPEHLEHMIHTWMPVLSALFITLVVLVVGLRFRSAVAKDGAELVPDGKFSLRFVIESLLEVVHSLGKDNCGAQYRNYLPLLGGLFVFILFTNLSGLIPGFPPATESIDTNLAMGAIVFLVYNYAGIKEHGAGYIKQFFGPVVFIAPLFFMIEIISHVSRPFSLSLRLLGNIFGDHLLLGVFTGLTYVVLPAALMFFGLLVSVVQSFVFTLLAGLYISMAISHDH